MYLREIDGTKHPGPRPQRQQASSRCIHKLVAPSPLPIRSPFSEISVSLIKERHHHQPAGPRYNTTLAHPHPTNTLKPTPTGNSRRSRLTLDQATPPPPNTQPQWQQSCHTTPPNRTSTTDTYHHRRRRWTTPSARFLPSRTSSASQTRARPRPRRTPRFPSVGFCRQSALVPFSRLTDPISPINKVRDPTQLVSLWESRSDEECAPTKPAHVVGCVV